MSYNKHVLCKNALHPLKCIADNTNTVCVLGETFIFHVSALFLKMAIKNQSHARRFLLYWCGVNFQLGDVEYLAALEVWAGRKRQFMRGDVDRWLRSWLGRAILGHESWSAVLQHDGMMFRDWDTGKVRSHHRCHSRVYGERIEVCGDPSSSSSTGFVSEILGSPHLLIHFAEVLHADSTFPFLSP